MSAQSPPGNLLETYWKLVSVEGAPVEPAAGMREAHLVLHTTGNQLGAIGGVNQMGGTWGVSGHALTLIPGPMTRMAGPEPLMKQETRFVELLGRVNRYEITGDRLTLTYDKTYQLTREHRSGTHAYDTTHVWDPVGNRLVKIENGARTTSTFDAANQILTAKTAGGTTTFTFDSAGNQRTDKVPGGGTTTNTWDNDNRRTKVHLATGVVNTSTYAIGSLVVVGAAVVSALIVRRRVNRLDLIRVLKTRE